MSETPATEPVQPTQERPTPRLAALLTGPFDIRSISLTGLFGLAVVYTMYFTRAILLPIVLAMLLSQLLIPLVRILAKWRIPQMVGSGIILLFFCGVFVVAVSFLTGPMKGWDRQGSPRRACTSSRPNWPRSSRRPCKKCPRPAAK